MFSFDSSFSFSPFFYRKKKEQKSRRPAKCSAVRALAAAQQSLRSCLYLSLSPQSGLYRRMLKVTLWSGLISGRPYTMILQAL
jgi:hypothetical protein